MHTAAWLWPIEYEPRVGGAERGLSSEGGTVTAWEEPRHFQTRSKSERNQLDYTLEQRAGATLLRYVHTRAFTDDVEYQACVLHTDFYYHSLGEYLRHFAGRELAYATADVPDTFAELCGRLRLPAGATVDYRTSAFLGVRIDDALLRVYGREAWGGPVSVALHLFAENADPPEAERRLNASLNPTEVTV